PSLRPVSAATRIWLCGNALRRLMPAAIDPTEVSTGLFSNDWQLLAVAIGGVYVTVSVGELLGAKRDGCMNGPPLSEQRWPHSLHWKFSVGPYMELSCELVGLNSGVPGGPEQSSSLVRSTMARMAFGRRKPAFCGGGCAPSAPSARAIDASW